MKTVCLPRGDNSRERMGERKEEGGINLGLILIKPPRDFNLFFFETRFLRAHTHI